MGRAIPDPDRSNWTANLPTAKPADPEHTKAFARAVRSRPCLWRLFLQVKPDEWMSEEALGKLSLFAAEYEAATGQRPNRGNAYALLRDVAEGRISSLD
jgi:hypothetical protein